MSARSLAWVAGVAFLAMLAAIWCLNRVLDAADGQFNRTADFVLLVTGQEPMGAALTFERVAEVSGLAGFILFAAALVVRARRLRLRPKS